MAPNFDIKRAFEINLDHKKIHRRFDEFFFSFPHGGIDLFYFFRQDFVDFAHTSKEILSGKLISGAVTNENQIRGVRTCIENIEALLQTPNCLKVS